MNTTHTVTSDELLELFFTDLELAGFEESSRTDVTAYGVSIHLTKPGVPVKVTVRLEEAGQPGISDILAVTVNELDASGWPSGVRHEISHLTPRNRPAVAALIAALAEAAL